MKHLTIQQLARYYADLIIASNNLKAVATVRLYGERLMADYAFTCEDREDYRDALAVVLDPQYSVTRVRFDRSEKHMLEEGIARRVWNLTCNTAWKGVNHEA